MAMPIYATPTIRVDKIEFSLSEKVVSSVNPEELLKSIQEEFEGHLKKIAYEAKEYWASEAGKKLNTSRESYLKSLTVSDNGDGTFSIILGGGKGGKANKTDKWLAKAVESGIPAFDMKPGFLGGADRRVIKFKPKDEPTAIYRTVTKTQMNKWIHPGITSRNIAEKVVKYIDKKLVPKHFEEAFNAATKSHKAGVEKAYKKASKGKK